MIIDPYGFRPVKILDIIRESPLAVSIKLDINEVSFQCGQYLIVRVPVNGTKLMRQYSISSAPSDKELWITVSETPGGAVSGWFNKNSKVSDSIEVSKPFSGGIVQNYTRGKICMIAGGSGIVPLMSYVRQLRKEARPFSLLYSTRSSNRCYYKELSPLQNERIDINISDEHGRISTKNVEKSLKGCSSVYICGSKSFVESCKKMCQKVNPALPLYSESFTL